MTNSDFVKPSIAAIAIAAIYPLYWIYEFAWGDTDFSVPYYAESSSLEFADLIFLILGALSIYVYVSLKRILHEHHNYHHIDIPITLIVANAIFFYVGIFAIDATMLLMGDQLSLGTQEFLVVGMMIILVGSNIISGVLNILIAVMLLRDSQSLPSVVRAFAIVTLVVGLCEVTVLFALVTIFIYPVVFAILAAYFHRGPEMIEVV